MKASIKIGLIVVALGAMVVSYFRFVKNQKVDPKNTPIVAIQVETGEGKGALSSSGRKLTVHYEIFISKAGKPGKKIDSSKDRNVPFDFLLGTGQVFAGWDKAMESMQVGNYREVVIPAALAYGDVGLKGLVPPNSDLILQVELLRID